jgi:hypothetical protein
MPKSALLSITIYFSLWDPERRPTNARIYHVELKPLDSEADLREAHEIALRVDKIEAVSGPASMDLAAMQQQVDEMEIVTGLLQQILGPHIET